MERDHPVEWARGRVPIAMRGDVARQMQEYSHGLLGRQRLTLERLESRWLMASVDWINRLSGSDTFTVEERAVVDRAIEIWNEIVVDRPGVGALQLTVTGGATSGTNLGGSIAAQTTATAAGNGQTTAATITMDDDGGGAGWYVDLQPNDNKEYHAANTPYSLASGPAGVDLLGTVLHEVAHALGFGTTTHFASKLTPEASGNRTYHGANGLSATLLSDGAHLSAAVHADELLNNVQPSGTRNLPTPLDVKLLADAYDYVVHVPGEVANSIDRHWLARLYHTLLGRNAATGELDYWAAVLASGSAPAAIVAGLT